MKHADEILTILAFMLLTSFIAAIVALVFGNLVLAKWFAISGASLLAIFYLFIFISNLIERKKGWY